MDMSEHFVRFLVQDRLAWAREQARRRALLPVPARRSLRARLGEALVALGHRLLLEGAEPQRSTW